jgi:nucleoside 2-deoxyribosyltransferase
MPNRRTVYLAGPLGFTDAGSRYHYEVLVPRVVAAGFDVLDPWSSARGIFGSLDDKSSTEQLQMANQSVGRANTKMIEECGGVLAVVDGSDVDSGTAAEIGYAAAVQKPVIGLRTDFRMSGDNAASPINLQVLFFILNSGGAIAHTLDEAMGNLVRVMAALP